MAAGREVRALHSIVGDELIFLEVRIIEQFDERFAKLAQIVWRNVRRHADGNARRTIEQRVGNAGRQNDRLFLGAIVIRPEGDGRLPDFLKQFGGNRSKATFGVAISSGSITIHRAEVARAINERGPHHPRLRHANHRIVNRAVAMGVIPAHDVAHDRGGLSMLGGGVQAALPHGVENAALHGFETIAHIRQRATGDDRECIIKIARARGIEQCDGIVWALRRNTGCGLAGRRGATACIKEAVIGR